MFICHFLSSCSTPLLASGSSAGKSSFEAADEEVTSEYGTSWMEGQMQTVDKLSEVRRSMNVD